MTGRPGGPTPGSTEGLTVPQVIQATRIIWFGMLMAQISFGLVIALIGGPLWKGPGPSPLSMPLSLMLGAFVVATIAVQAIFRRNFVAEVRGRAEQLRQEADPLASVLVPYRASSSRPSAWSREALSSAWSVTWPPGSPWAWSFPRPRSRGSS